MNQPHPEVKTAQPANGGGLESVSTQATQESLIISLLLFRHISWVCRFGTMLIFRASRTFIHL